MLEDNGQIGNAVTNELEPLGLGEVALMLCEFLALALSDGAIDRY
jgi:hypothetical protein